MSKEYKELISKINVEISPENMNCVKWQFLRANILTIMALVLSVIALAGAFIGKTELGLLLIPAYILIVVRRIVIGKYYMRLSKIATDKCDPQKVLEEYMCILSRIRRGNFNQFYYVIACMLSNVGRFEDACRVLELYEKRHSKTEDEIVREYVYVALNSARNDAKGLEEHCEKLEMAYARCGRPAKYVEFYERSVAVKSLFEVRQAGNYYDMIAAYEAVQASELSNPDKVSRNYTLYTLARDNGLTEEAMNHRNYVINNGGTMWQRNAIMNETA